MSIVFTFDILDGIKQNNQVNSLSSRNVQPNMENKMYRVKEAEQDEHRKSADCEEKPSPCFSDSSGGILGLAKWLDQRISTLPSSVMSQINLHSSQH